jgi:CheY-like chemotaxis protein
MSKVLLVEDDPLVYRMYQKALTLEGFDNETAVDGREGLAKAREYMPDIILLDIMMPNMNGVEMLTHLKSDPTTVNIPVIVLTNISDMRVSHEVSAKGAVMTIAKSDTEPDQVIGWIRSVIDKSQSETTNQPGPA